MITHRSLRIVLVLAAVACASAQRTDTPRATRDSTLLTGPELQANAGLNLYDQIQKLRPNWLRTRGLSSLTQSIGDIVVYRDGVRHGSPQILRDFTVESVDSVRFLSGPEASSRFGLDHQHGAILVTSRKR